MPLYALLKRNILNYLATGKYIDARKLEKSHKLALSALHTEQHKFATHADLVRSAGYYMDSIGRVTATSDGKIQLQTSSAGDSPQTPRSISSINNRKDSSTTGAGAAEAVQHSQVVKGPSAASITTTATGKAAVSSKPGLIRKLSGRGFFGDKQQKQQQQSQQQQQQQPNQPTAVPDVADLRWGEWTNDGLVFSLSPVGPAGVGADDDDNSDYGSVADGDLNDTEKLETALDSLKISDKTSSKKHHSKRSDKSRKKNKQNGSASASDQQSLASGTSTRISTGTANMIPRNSSGASVSSASKSLTHSPRSLLGAEEDPMDDALRRKEEKQLRMAAAVQLGGVIDGIASESPSGKSRHRSKKADRSQVNADMVNVITPTKSASSSGKQHPLVPPVPLPNSPSQPQSSSSSSSPPPRNPPPVPPVPVPVLSEAEQAQIAEREERIRRWHEREAAEERQAALDAAELERVRLEAEAAEVERLAAEEAAKKQRLEAFVRRPTLSNQRRGSAVTAAQEQQRQQQASQLLSNSLQSSAANSPQRDTATAAPAAASLRLPLHPDSSISSLPTVDTHNYGGSVNEDSDTGSVHSRQSAGGTGAAAVHTPLARSSSSSSSSGKFARSLSRSGSEKTPAESAEDAGKRRKLLESAGAVKRPDLYRRPSLPNSPSRKLSYSLEQQQNSGI